MKIPARLVGHSIQVSKPFNLDQILLENKTADEDVENRSSEETYENPIVVAVLAAIGISARRLGNAVHTHEDIEVRIHMEETSPYHVNVPSLDIDPSNKSRVIYPAIFALSNNVCVCYADDVSYEADSYGREHSVTIPKVPTTQLENAIGKPLSTIASISGINTENLLIDSYKTFKGETVLTLRVS